MPFEADSSAVSALIAVQDLGLARSLAGVAEGAGLRALVVSPELALEDALRESLAIAIVDLDAPEAGLAVCRAIRAAAGDHALPIIGVTSNPAVPAGTSRAGVTDYVTKPVDREILGGRIAFQLEILAAPAEAQASSPAAEAPPEPGVRDDAKTIPQLIDPTDPPASAGGALLPPPVEKRGPSADDRLRRLELAQSLAGIGYWEWDVESGEVLLGPGTAAVLQLRDPLPSHVSELIAACVPEEDRQRFAAALYDAVAGEKVPDGLLSNVRDGDTSRFFKHFVSATRSPDGGQLVTVSVLDVTHERRAEESARRIAFYDALTGLPNRRLFERRLGNAMRRFADQADSVALLFLDLDGFKQVNDRLGHAAGDELLRIVGHRLLDSVRGSDDVGRVSPSQGSVSRFGGDEFAVLITGINEPEDAADCARRIHAKLSEPIQLSGGEARVGVSVGIALYPRDGESASALFSAADAAMYAAKSDRNTIYCFYRGELQAPATRYRQIAEQLAGADARGELSLLWQPKFDLVTGHISGAEALLRWENPLLGAVPPTEFIPIAEDTGVILKIGRWVLMTACQEATAWSSHTLFPPSSAINISRVQLVQGNLEQDVFDALRQSKLDPRSLEIEITESLMIEGENALAPLRDLGAIGLKLALDDFGSGYSTLASLVRFPVNTLKLDRALVRDVDSNPDAASIVRAAIRMAHELGRRVVAEGVDSLATLRALRESDCDEAQGFFLARPMPAAEFRALLESWRPAEALASWR